MISKLKNLSASILILPIIGVTGVLIYFLITTYGLDFILLYILIFPIIGILILLLIPAQEEKLLKSVALFFACLSLIGSLLVWYSFQSFQESCCNTFLYTVKFLLIDNSKEKFLLISSRKWFWGSSSNCFLTLGIVRADSYLLLFTTLLIMLCILISWNKNTIKNLKEFLIAFLVLDFFYIGTSCVLDLLLFHTFFVSALIFMFLIVIIFGPREKKIVAAYYFFLFILLVLVSHYAVFYSV